jgi:hypothetical protein
MGGLHGSKGDILLEEASTKMKYETLIFSPSCQLPNRFCGPDLAIACKHHFTTAY